MNPLMLLITLLKPLLYPLSILYGVIVWLRNRLYDAGFISSIKFSVPVISVGNLSTGGTGKTPHIEYLIRLLEYEYRVATMSRGYKRSSTGFYLATTNTDVRMIGDEPMQFYRKFPDAVISVCEDRMTGIPRLLTERPDVDVVLLDDAFQHRSVKPGLNILIVDFYKPFFKDYILPFGSLREGRKAYKRADVIIVSKCPENLSAGDKQSFTNKINLLTHQKIYFSKIEYDYPTNIFTGAAFDLSTNIFNIVLVSGIAKPEPMLHYLKQMGHEVHLLRYPDHHYFTQANMDEIASTCRNWEGDNKIVLTTEKDATRLERFSKELDRLAIPVLVLPIKVTFLENGAAFDNIVKEYIAAERIQEYF